jgi:hypothetical protein
MRRRAPRRTVAHETGLFQISGAMNFLALLSLQNLLRVLSFHSTLIFFALLVLLVAGVFIWAVAIRKPTRRRSSRRHSKPKDEVTNPDGAGAQAPRTVRRRRRRRRPRQPLNPTLAQTHGLPPLRDKESTPPPSY